MWLSVQGSLQGARATNDDYLVAETLRYGAQEVSVLAGCDGVGGLPGSGACAAAAAGAAVTLVDSYLRGRDLANPLGRRDKHALSAGMPTLPMHGSDGGQACTLALAIWHAPHR